MLALLPWTLVHLVAAELAPVAGPKPFTYTNATDALPHYISGAQWGTEGSPIKSMQVPMSPEASAQRVVLREGFQAARWAAEPQIKKPLTMTWDARGRLWIAETVDYPNELQPPGQGRDRILICEDRDQNGRAETFTVFAEGLSIPTGMVHSRDGLIVIESGRTLFLRDSDGDDKADERVVLFEGWGMGDTHATASNLRYGHDNWIWGVVGYSGFRGTVGGRYHEFGMGVFRFTPDGKHLEFMRSSNNNTWGLGLSEEGFIFGSTANNNASWFLPIPNRYYEHVRGWSAARMESIADSQAFHPITDKVRQVDAHGRYTAGAGHALYTARGFPKDYWNRIAFVAEPTGHLIGHFRLEGEGADFKALNQKSFLASDDEWFAPIMAEVGPDGALWFIDWYNYIIQHNPAPRGFKTGKGNAYETPLRDKRHGRIYRVTHRDGKFPKAPVLDPKAPGDLVVALTSDNMLTRLQAQQRLVERGQRDVVASLCGLVRNLSSDELGLNPGALHALWTLHGLGAIQSGVGAAYDTAVSALRHPSAAVRRAALQTIPRNPNTEQAIAEAASLLDPNAQVRLAALLALAEFQPSTQLGQKVYASLQSPLNHQDRWLRDAIVSAAARHLDGFLKQGLLADKNPLSLDPAAWPAVETIVAHLAADHPANVVTAVLVPLQAAEAPKANAVLDGLAQGWGDAPPPALTDQDQEQIRNLYASIEASSKDRLIALLGKWNHLQPFNKERTETTLRLAAQLAHQATPESTRTAAARNLIRIADTPATIQSIVALIHPTTSPRHAAELVQTIALSKQAFAGSGLLSGWAQMTPSARRAAAAVLLRRPEWAQLLLDAVEKGAVHRNDLGRDHWSQLRQHPDAKVSDRARKLQTAATASKGSAELEATIARLLPVATKPGNAKHGQGVYEKNCQVCHTPTPQGFRIGPDLIGIGARPKADVLVDILDPNRSVEANYRLWNVTTKTGESFAGRLDSESATAVEILDTAGQKHVLQRSAIDRMEASTLSLMPGGFEQLSETDLSALLEYLASQTEPARR